MQMNAGIGRTRDLGLDSCQNMQREIVASLPIQTKDGEFLASYSSAGLCALRFPRARKTRAVPTKVPAVVSRWHTLAENALRSSLEGRSPRKLPPLDMSAGTEFQQLVWAQLSRIDAGNTMSYKEVARAIGKPQAVRAVGGACGANPIPVLVPCHRVLAANCKLGGFSGGLAWKRTLLRREGAWEEKRN